MLGIWTQSKLLVEQERRNNYKGREGIRQAKRFLVAVRSPHHDNVKLMASIAPKKDIKTLRKRLGPDLFISDHYGWKRAFDNQLALHEIFDECLLEDGEWLQGVTHEQISDALKGIKQKRKDDKRKRREKAIAEHQEARYTTAASPPP